mmetsp:Transcript_29452/g.59747  ORF Transcript_29452/g.59747 Transcript_29452/m.59747 type:complete len:355 (+) Transcript_29452:411-1475(+)
MVSVVALTQAMDFANPPKIGAVIRGTAPVSSLSYHDDGVHLFVTSEGDSRLRLVNCDSGTSEKPATKFEREGIRMAEKTHHDLCVIYTGKGTKEQPPAQRHAVHYLSLHDNKILRNFSGHTGEITNISMSPVDDTFLTSSADKTVKLWTLEKAGCVAELHLPPMAESKPYACFDGTGLVFGVAVSLGERSDEHAIHLYDARNYKGGPFSEMKVSQSSVEAAIQGKGIAPDVASTLSKGKWNSMSFNKSGDQILIGAETGLGIVLNGYEGTVDSVLLSEGAASLSDAAAFTGCFTPEDRTILGGNQDGTITCWDAKSGAVTSKLERHTGRVNCIAANPKNAQIASADTNTALWMW